MDDKIKQNIDVYNKFAKIYADYTSEKLFQFQLNKFISLLKKPSKVLDVGCGAGRDAAYFNEEGFNVIGIDLSDGMLKEAKSRSPKVKFEKMDFIKTSFKNEEFDGIWCMASLQDIPKKDTSKAINEFNRILKKAGIIYIAVKKGEGEKVIKKKLYEDHPKFYSFFNQPELEQSLTVSGFQIVSSLTTDDAGIEWIEIFARKI